MRSGYQAGERAASHQQVTAGAVPRIGVFGGTFDPVHLGHLLVAEAARESLGLDRVIFVPAGDPWHRADTPGAAGVHRLAMARLAVDGNPAFSVSAVDLERSGPTYTVDTLTILHGQLDPADLVFLIGLDALNQIGKWHTPARIADLADIVALRRPGAPPFNPAALETVIPRAGDRIRQIESPLVDISATDVRRRVRDGHSIRYRVMPAVEAYIAEHGLYRAQKISMKLT